MDLQIEVLDEPEFTRVCKVEEDGSIAFPHLGRLAVAGQIPTDVRTSLQERLRKYLRDPLVAVVPLAADHADKQGESDSGTILVMGDVDHPGSYALTGPTPVAQVLALCGWFSERSHGRMVWVIRPRLEHRAPSMVVCDFRALLVEGDLAQDVPLQRCDMVYVPRDGASSDATSEDWQVAVSYLAVRMTTDELVRRLCPSGIDEEATALRMVNARPEVIAWRIKCTGYLLTHPFNGTTLHVASHGRDGGGWLIQVYEDVPDDPPDEGHTATFDWYHVDIQSHTVTSILCPESSSDGAR